MVSWPAVEVAALAVGGAGSLVIEDRTSPRRGCMARRTLPAEVIGRPAADMAALAVGGAGCLVIEGCPRPR